MPLVVRVPRNTSVLRREGPYPSAINVLNRKETAVQRQLRRGGLASYEPPTQATLLALMEVAPKPATFLDVGAHIGLYSALIDAVFPEGSVDARAFEPTPATADIARRLSLANNLTVLVEEVAVSSSPGTAQFYVSAKSESSNSMTEGFREALETLDVDVTTIDAYCQERQVRPAVIKIDVETLESHVLFGGMQTFREARPSIVFEILFASDHDHLGQALKEMEGLGYTLYHVNGAGDWTKTVVEEYRRFVSREQRDWLLVPGDLPRGFDRARKRWLSAISKCDQDTNLLIPPGTRLPGGWNSPYPRHAWTPRRVARGVLRRARRVRGVVSRLRRRAE